MDLGYMVNAVTGAERPRRDAFREGDKRRPAP
jgi:hypothetical protein